MEPDLERLRRLGWLARAARRAVPGAVAVAVAVLGAALTLSGAGCSRRGGSGDGAGAASTGEVRLYLVQAPADVRCIRLTAAGTRTVTTLFDVTPGQGSMFTLSGLPLGQVTIAADALAVACAQVTSGSVPTWVSDASVVTVVAGAASTITLAMHRPGQIAVSVDFPSADAGMPAQPHTATDVVSAGGVASSKSFKMVYTFGQSTQNQGKAASASDVVRGGLEGANGSEL